MSNFFAKLTNFLAIITFVITWLAVFSCLPGTHLNLGVTNKDYLINLWIAFALSIYLVFDTIARRSKLDKLKMSNSYDYKVYVKHERYLLAAKSVLFFYSTGFSIVLLTDYYTAWLTAWTALSSQIVLAIMLWLFFIYIVFIIDNYRIYRKAKYLRENIKE